MKLFQAKEIQSLISLILGMLSSILKGWYSFRLTEPLRLLATLVNEN